MAYYDTDLVARWYFDEGNGTTVADSEATPANLTFNDTANTAWDTTTTNQTGISWTSIGSTGKVGAALTTKLVNALNATAFTVEIVCHIDTVSGTDAFLFSALDGAGNYGELSIQLNSGGSLNVNHQFGGFDTVSFTYDIVAANRVVLHLVFDSSLATATDRTKLYADGVQITSKSTVGTDEPDQNNTLDLTTGDFLAFGNASEGTENRSIDGLISFGAIHSAALTATQCSDNATALATIDDGITNTVPNTPTITATPSGSTVSLSSSAFSDPDAGDTHASSRWRIYRVV